MLEVLSPAGSSDALVAAVQNGADAVYLGYGSFNARMNAKNFTSEQLRQSVSYCHIRGVKVYLTLNTLVLDRELKAAAQVVLEAKNAGVDAILVQDLGVLQMVRQVAPDMPIHASTQMSVHNLEGVLKAAEMGISRVVLARELSRSQIAAICQASPIELEVFVHGALCMCHSGQCYMSAMIGRRSGNRGQCAQPCRMSYGFDRSENRYPLSLKDNCLVSYLRDLDRMGVACVKIEGRMKRAEYVAITTRIYKDAAQGKPVTDQQIQTLRKVFSRQGFTDGYYKGKIGADMFGTRQDEEQDRKLFAAARATYEHSEAQRVTVAMEMSVRYGYPTTLTAIDKDGNWAQVQGDMPELAVSRPLDQAALAQRLSKSGGTPYAVSDVSLELEEGLILSAASVNAMRREVLDRLSALRGQVPETRTGVFAQPPVYTSVSGQPVFTVSVQTTEQLTRQLRGFCPALLYMPLSMAVSRDPAVTAALQSLRVAVVLPRVVLPGQWDAILQQLNQAWTLGIRDALVGNIGMIDPVRRVGFALHGDFGLNVFNSGSANTYAGMGLSSLTASFELTLPQIRDLSKPVPTELIAFGRVPMMITENCVIHSRTGSCTCGSGSTNLVDRTGSRFPVMRDGDTCRSVIYNSRKLYWADRLGELQNLGLWALRLNFTTENDQQVNTILQDYARGGTFDPGVSTRGLYLRGVE
ncbi:MAG: U32 family peptidase [Oscillospiraceae bacterium]|nr:U32 family peptidase [Oscillospiraceae bacterium]